jgi:rhodanese-related sulfurtransferase
LQLRDENSFVSQLLGSLGSYPPYFRRLGEINRIGPPLLEGDPTLAALSVNEVRTRLADGAVLIDARPVHRFAAAHVGGAISNPLRPVFASWLGWLAPADRPLIIVRDPEQDHAEIAWQAAKIGCDNIIGELDGGIAAWTAAGHDTASIPLARAAQLDGRRVLDIRQRSEYLDGHLPGAMHIELGDVAQRAAEVPDEPTVVMCGHGERAMGAASLLAGTGHHDLVVLDGGPQDWAAATGGQLQAGG